MAVGDDFNRTDSAGLGSKWFDTSPGNWTISGNAALGVGSGSVAMWIANTFNSDQTIQVKCVGAISGSDFQSVYSRCQALNTNDCYIVLIDGSPHLRQGINSGGVTSWIDVDSGVFADDTIGQSCIGNIMRMQRNGGSVGSGFTDSTYASGRYQGFYAANGVKIDDFVATGEDVNNTAFSYDLFTDSNGTSVTSHTPTYGGGTWSGGNAKIQSNRACGNDGSTQESMTLSVSPPGADYSVECDLVYLSAGANDIVGVVGRSDGINVYYVYFYESDLRFHLRDASGELGFWDDSGLMSPGQTVRLRLEMLSTAIKVYVNDIQRISVTNSSAVNPGHPGFIVRISQAGTGIHIDNLVSRGPVATAAPTARLGVFDTQLRNDLWFADDLAILSWFDRDLVDTSSIYTATVACTVGAATTSASATFSPGTKTATAACTVGHATTSGSATFTVPTYHGTVACTVGHATTAGVATFTVPTYHGTAACTVGHATTSASATFVAPIYTATAACTVGHATTSGSATFVGLTYQATAACTVGHATTSGSATFSPGVHTATAACTVGHATTSGSATFAPGTHTAAATCVVGHATASGSATFSAGVHTATAAVTVGHATVNGSATFTGPVYTGSAAVTIGHVTAAATGIFATVVRSASAVCTVGRATANATASFTVPTYQGSAACTVGHATCSGVGTFFSTYHGSAVCTTGKVTTSGSATFTLPTRTATAALIAPHALCSGAALVLNPFYDASAACTIGPIIVSAAGLFTLGLGLPAIILPVVLARGTLVLQVPGRRRATSAVAEVRGALRLPTAILGE